MANHEKPRVLIIGAGFAGATLATKINGFADVTLVDPKDYLEITWATVRSIVDEGVATRSVIRLKDIPNIGHLVQATVTRLTSKEAVLSNGETLTFDYAAICTGSSYSEAFKSSTSLNREHRLEELKAVHAEIRAAKSIVVVGGGPSGVEATAEVVEAFAGKSITLIHPAKHLLTTAPPRAGAKAKQFLESKGVQVKLGVSVQSQPVGRGAATLTLSDGSNLSADLVLWCAGAKPNTAYLGEDLAAVRDDRGLIKVDSWDGMDLGRFWTGYVSTAPLSGAGLSLGFGSGLRTGRDGTWRALQFPVHFLEDPRTPAFFHFRPFYRSPFFIRLPIRPPFGRRTGPSHPPSRGPPENLRPGRLQQCPRREKGLLGDETCRTGGGEHQGADQGCQGREVAQAWRLETKYGDGDDVVDAGPQ